MDFIRRYRQPRTRPKEDTENPAIPRIRLIKMSAVLVFSIVLEYFLADAATVSKAIDFGCDKKFLLRMFPTLKKLNGDSIKNTHSTKRKSWVADQIANIPQAGEVFCVHILPEILSWEAYCISETESEDQEWFFNSYEARQYIELVNRYYSGKLGIKQDGCEWCISLGSMGKQNVDSPDDYIEELANTVIKLVSSGRTIC